VRTEIDLFCPLQRKVLMFLARGAVFSVPNRDGFIMEELS
jgi:hypothetical protein